MIITDGGKEREVVLDTMERGEDWGAQKWKKKGGRTYCIREEKIKSKQGHAEKEEAKTEKSKQEK